MFSLIKKFHCFYHFFFAKLAIFVQNFFIAKVSIVTALGISRVIDSIGAVLVFLICSQNFTASGRTSDSRANAGTKWLFAGSLKNCSNSRLYIAFFRGNRADANSEYTTISKPLPKHPTSWSSLQNWKQFFSSIPSTFLFAIPKAFSSASKLTCRECNRT